MTRRRRLRGDDSGVFIRTKLARGGVLLFGSSTELVTGIAYEFSRGKRET